MASNSGQSTPRISWENDHSTSPSPEAQFVLSMLLSEYQSTRDFKQDASLVLVGIRGVRETVPRFHSRNGVELAV